MSRNRLSRRKSHVVAERPPFERIALLLQGGDAAAVSDEPSLTITGENAQLSEILLFDLA